MMTTFGWKPSFRFGLRPQTGPRRVAIIVRHEQHLTVVEGVRRGRHWSMTRAVRIARQADSEAAQEPDSVGLWLKKELSSAGITAKHVILAMPRAGAVLKHLELPVANETELPALVWLQAEARGAGSLADGDIDFLPLPSHRSQVDAMPQILLVSLPHKILSAPVAALRSAGLTVVAATVSTLGLAALDSLTPRDHVGIADGLHLVVAGDDEQFDLTLSRQRTPIASQTIHCDTQDAATTAQQLESAAARMIAALPAELSDGGLSSVMILAAPKADELQLALRTRMNVDVR
ncbi:MAG TPA: hypothetical protein VK137_11350, partial [Planctomycetaceae bacterium]|nr:hypothetical protein [Planctomycetaceae bacterium]